MMNSQPITRLWRDSVLDALVRVSSSHGTELITRHTLIEEELARIVEETQSIGTTPRQTLSLVLQKLRDEGVLQFLGGGVYRLSKQPIDMELAELTDPEIDAAIRAHLLRFGRVKTGDTKALSQQRRGQHRVRVLTLENYRSRCALCDVCDGRLLVASHIVPWANSIDARGDLTNVICLCRFHDPLFERGYWSLRDDMSVLCRSPLVSKTLQMLLSPELSFVFPAGHSPERHYLQFHRQKHGFEV